MLTLKCLGSGSSGNCWILDYNGASLILDAGLPVKTIKRGVDYNLVGIRGICISHTHKDHAMAVADLRKMGLSVFAPYESENPPKKVEFLPYSVQIFPLPHGDVANYGFLIKVDDHRILYMTDFEYCKYSFNKIQPDAIIIECNYQTKYLDMEAENIQHKVLGHAEIETTKEFVRTNLTDRLKNVILTHLGVGTCDGNECVEEIKKVVREDIRVDYARPNESYLLDSIKEVDYGE